MKKGKEEKRAKEACQSECESPFDLWRSKGFWSTGAEDSVCSERIKLRKGEVHWDFSTWKCFENGQPLMVNQVSQEDHRSDRPTIRPTDHPTDRPSHRPNIRPTQHPTDRPSDRPFEKSSRIIVFSSLTFFGLKPILVANRFVFFAKSSQNHRAKIIAKIIAHFSRFSQHRFFKTDFFPKSVFQNRFFSQIGFSKPFFPKIGFPKPIFPPHRFFKTVFSPKSVFQNRFFPTSVFQNWFFTRIAFSKPIFPQHRFFKTDFSPTSVFSKPIFHQNRFC